MAYAQPASTFDEIARPFAWLALFAFLTGFAISLAVHLGQAAGVRDDGPALRPSIVRDAPQGAGWNAPKAI